MAVSRRDLFRYAAGAALSALAVVYVPGLKADLAEKEVALHWVMVDQPSPSLVSNIKRYATWCLQAPEEHRMIASFADARVAQLVLESAV